MTEGGIHGLFDTSDPDDLRAALDAEQVMRIAFATQLASLAETSDDPMMVALAASFRAAGVRERRLRNALKIAVAG